MFKTPSKKNPHEYQFDPAFNKNLVLRYTPLPEIDIAKLPPLDENWMEGLSEIILKINTRLSIFKLDTHAGKESTYPTKEILYTQLQLIYHRLQGNLDFELGALSTDSRASILSQLIENIELCTEGFHNRVNIIANSFYQPRNLDELLYNVRKEIVEGTAFRFTKEVHTWNRFNIIAARDGFGIKSPIQDHNNLIKLSEFEIRCALQSSFSKKFTPFNLPNLLIDEFIKFVPELEFEKKKENGLPLQFITKIENLIQLFLPDYINNTDNDPNNWKNYFIIDYNKEDPLIFKFTNLNFEKLYQSFFNSLVDKKYFEAPLINTLTESAFYNLVLKKNPLHPSEQLIFLLFKEERLSILLAQLVELNEKFPEYYSKLSKNKFFITHCLALIEYLNNQLQINEIYSAEIILGYHLILDLDLRRKNYIVEKITDALLLENQVGLNLLMMGSQYSPPLVNAILTFITYYRNIINSYNPQIFKKMFLMKNNYNQNALMIAAIYHVEAVEMLLNFLGKHINDLDNPILQEFFLEKQVNNYNVLMLAAAKQAKAFITILNFLTEYVKYFAKDTLYKLFTQKQKNSYSAVTLIANFFPIYINNALSFITDYIKIDREMIYNLFFENSSGTCAALMSAVENQVEATHSILKFISANIASFDPELLNEMFLKQNLQGNSIIMLAARHQPNALTSILNFINTHINHFILEKIPEFFTLCNSDNFNCLMLAADYNPSSLIILFNFINEKIKIFSNHLKQLFFTKTNEKGYPTLTLARHYPEPFLLLINFYLNYQLITLDKLFHEEYNFGVTLFMVLAKDNADCFEPVLNFLEQHTHLFPPENWPQLITKKNELTYNSLMLAVRNHPDIVAIILNFIQSHTQFFSPTFIMDLLLAHDSHSNNTLMIAAQHQPEAVKLLLQFIQNQTNLPDFINEFLFTHGSFSVNVLMMAATHHVEAVKPLLEFFTRHLKYFNYDEIYDFVFKKVYDREAYITSFFTDSFSAKKSVLSVTAQLKEQTGSDSLLSFIDNHIDYLGIKIFLELLTEKDDNGNYSFQLAYSRCPFILKRILNFIATLDDFDLFKPAHHLVVDFVFDQLTRWPNPSQDEKLFFKITICCSSFLLDQFSLDRFKSRFSNLKILTEILLNCLFDNLEQKNSIELSHYYFFRLFSSTGQEFKAVSDLKKIFYFELDKKEALKQFATKHYKFLKPKFSLNSLFIACQKIAALQAEKTCENDSRLSQEEHAAYLL